MVAILLFRHSWIHSIYIFVDFICYIYFDKIDCENIDKMVQTV